MPGSRQGLAPAARPDLSWRSRIRRIRYGNLIAHATLPRSRRVSPCHCFPTAALSSCRYPLRAADDRLAPEFGDDLVQVLDVPDLDLDADLEKVGRPIEDRQVGDIAVVLSDDKGDLCERSRFVEHRYDDFGREPLVAALGDIPGKVDPALRFVVELLQRLCVNRIDRDPLPGSEYAD